MKAKAGLAVVMAMGVALGALQAAEPVAFAVALVVPRGETYVEPAEGVFVMSRWPAAFHVRIMNTSGAKKAVQADVTGACALELTDARGVTTMVRHKPQMASEAGAEAVVDLENGDTVTVAVDLDASRWDGVPGVAAGQPQTFDMRAVYRSVNGKPTYSKPYTLMIRL